MTGTDDIVALAKARVGAFVRRSVLGIWEPLGASSIADEGMRAALMGLPSEGGPDALWFTMGKTQRKYRYECLEQMPHLLVAGTTGSGKSVFLNGLLASLLIRHTPETLVLGLVDPKFVEFASYRKLPHLRGRGVISDVEGAIDLFQWAVQEMDNRLERMVDKGVKSLSAYNAKVSSGKMSRVVLVVDEFADLIMGSSRAEGQEFKTLITRIAQKARAAGIHLVLATQKPIVKVVDTLLKGNIPARVAFRVTNESESRVIMDVKGAEELRGRGDMYFKSPFERTAERLQGVWFPDSDLEKIISGG